MTDDPAHADNSDDYVGHNTPMKNGRDSSTPALLKTRHSSPTALDASVDAVAVRGVAEATRRGASGRSGLVGEDRAAGLLRNGFTDLLRVVAEFHGHERARDEDGNFGDGRILRNRLQIAALDEIVVR